MAEGVLAEVQAVKVHLTGSDVPLSAAAPARAEIVATFYTRTLTALAPAQLLAGVATSREYLIVQALDHEVVLCDSRGQAQAKCNAPLTGRLVSASAAITAGAGTFTATLPTGSTITKIDLATIVGSASTSTLVTVSGVAGGPYSFEYVSPSAGIVYWPDPTPPGGFPASSATATPAVTFTGVAGTGAGELTVLGTAAPAASPEGAVIPAGVATPAIRHSGEIWVAALVVPARVSVIAGYRR